MPNYAMLQSRQSWTLPPRSLSLTVVRLLLDGEWEDVLEREMPSGNSRRNTNTKKLPSLCHNWVRIPVESFHGKLSNQRCPASGWHRPTPQTAQPLMKAADRYSFFG